MSSSSSSSSPLTSSTPSYSPISPSVTANYNGNQPFQAISISSQQRYAAIGSCTHIKLMILNHNSSALTEYCTLPLKSFGNYTITDVSCNNNKNDTGKIAVSATNGAVCVFNIDEISSNYHASSSSSLSSSSSKKHALWENNECTRSVHSISWHATDTAILASASQDGAVRVFDCRKKSDACMSTYTARSDAARVVQFNPNQSNLIASIYENGTLVIWDMRNTDTPWIKIAAHTMCGLSLAWHPSREYSIATGSRDKCCKIWDLNSMGDDLPRPYSTLFTSSSVARVAWRPSTNYQEHLATTSVESGDISVWNTNKCYVPACILRGHSETVVDFEWLDTTVSSQSNSSNSKGAQVKDTFLGAYQHIISVSKDGQLCIQDLRNSYFPQLHTPSCVTAISSNGHVAFTRGGKARKDELCLTVNNHTCNAKGIYLENKDRFGIAFDISKSISSTSNSVALDSVVAPTNDATASTSTVATTVDSSMSNSVTPIVAKAVYGGPGKVYVGLADINDLNQACMIRRRRGAEGDLHDPAMVNLLAQEYKLGDCSSAAASPPSATDGGSGTSSHIDMVLSACTHNLSVATTAGLRSRVSLWASVLPLLQGISPVDATLSDECVPFTVELLGSILKELLEEGDCQHFVVLSELLRRSSLLQPAIEAASISEQRKLEAYLSYLDLLGKLQLTCAASSIIKYSDMVNISRLSINGVLMHIACAKCGKELADNVPNPWCTKCNRCPSICTVCNKPVRGLYHWCPVCGHGGHLSCYREWFKQSITCPSGCGHNCTSNCLDKELYISSQQQQLRRQQLQHQKFSRHRQQRNVTK